uniref:Uncharacterized protein n=1 Tax=Amphora coffeiformis TaxID=265554 RepID=A0A7S3L459_9STRA|mmetsp:Transcript_4576/g.9230  ORF Transcript_4576/g.9230 Transcript_4576/m.9230 type:complete len:334 (+) Transcript_4576:48-1049(+)
MIKRQESSSSRQRKKSNPKSASWIRPRTIFFVTFSIGVMNFCRTFHRMLVLGSEHNGHAIHHENTASSSWMTARNGGGLSEIFAQAVVQDFDIMTGCGYFKCFFPSLSDRENDDEKGRTGWLVTRARRYYKQEKRALYVYEYAHKAWEFAQQCQQTHGMKHYLLSPPFSTGRLSERVAKVLETKFNDTICNVRTGCRMAPRARFGFVVQRLRRAPSHAILAKLFVSRHTTANDTELTLSPFLPDFVPTIENATNFKGNLLTDIDATIRLLQDFPNLQVDLQFIISPDGFVFHIDLDRLFDVDLHPHQWRNKFHQTAIPSLHNLKQHVDTLLSQ